MARQPRLKHQHFPSSTCFHYSFTLIDQSDIVYFFLPRFLWKYHDHELKVFKCTGKNNYIALCEPEYISFGGGSVSSSNRFHDLVFDRCVDRDGHYGLYLDESLFDGSSAPCPTFNNEPLCSPGPRKGASVTFECVGLEVWGMGP